MLIGIDASKTVTATKTGIDKTAYQIILGLTEIDKENTYYLYTKSPLDKALLRNKNVKERLIPFPRLWNRFRLPLALFRDKPDIFIALTNGVPPYTPSKSIILIHDLAFKYFPEAYSKYELMLQKNSVKTALGKSSVIVFTSRANRDDFYKFYGKGLAQTEVIPLAYDSNKFKPNIECHKIINVDSPYLLYVGRLEKRKNVVRIVEAFNQFKNENGTGHKLIFAGKNGYGHEEIEEKIAKSKHKNDIVMLGYAKENDLPSLYKGADALIYTSLYEGFGLPALEAMAVGTPVLSSNVATIKEIVGDGALLVSPEEVSSIANGMKIIVLDQVLRKELVQKGREIVKKYSWKKTAEGFYQLIMKTK